MSSIRDIANNTAKQRSAISRRAKSERKSIPARLYSAMVYGQGSMVPKSYNKHELIRQIYERNPAFYAAVNMLAQTVADMPVYVQSHHHQEPKRSDNHPALRLLERNTTREELVEVFVKYLIVTGDGYANLVHTEADDSNLAKRKKPLGFVNMPSQYVDIVTGDWRQPIHKYRYTQNGQEEFWPSEVVHAKLASLSNPFGGMSPAEVLSETIDLNNAAITWNKNTALAGGVPSVIAKTMGGSEEDAKRLKQGWREQRGANAQHELTVVSENLEFENFAVDPHDAEWEQAVLQSMRIILMCLNISSSLMNDAGNKTYNNVKDARKALYNEGAIPLAKKVYAAFTKVVKPYYKDAPVYRVDTGKIDAIQEDKKAKVDRIVAAVNGGIITENEGRKELGYMPVNDPRADRLINTSLDNNTGAEENRESVPANNPNLPDESL